MGRKGRQGRKKETNGGGDREERKGTRERLLRRIKAELFSFHLPKGDPLEGHASAGK